MAFSRLSSKWESFCPLSYFTKHCLFPICICMHDAVSARVVIIVLTHLVLTTLLLTFTSSRELGSWFGALIPLTVHYGACRLSGPTSPNVHSVAQYTYCAELFIQNRLPALSLWRRSNFVYELVCLGVFSYSVQFSSVTWFMFHAVL